MTHEFPEWNKYKERLDTKQINQASMSYDDFFENPQENSNLLNGKFISVQKLFNQSPEQLHIAKEAYKENKEIDTLWV